METECNGMGGLDFIQGLEKEHAGREGFEETIKRCPPHYS